MQAVIEITPWHWVGFILVVLFFLALDLGVFHRHAHVVKIKEAMAWTALWFSLAMAFAGALTHLRGNEEAKQYLTGYILEYSLSMDNVFVIALIFSYFRVPQEYQHRVLFWGILGALIMRGLLISLGAVAIARFHAILYLLGGFLVISGIKMIFVADHGVHPEKNPVLRLARKIFPVVNEFEGQQFVTRFNGRQALTPLAVVLIMVETTDLVFAFDSIPAIFGVTQKPFIVFTSNVFAILGLRSLYFLLAGAIRYFRYLKVGLSFVLVFIGCKMLLPLVEVEISTTHSLITVAAIIFAAIGVSALMAWREGGRREAGRENATGKPDDA